MSIDYWTVDEDPYIDPDTKVLKNLAGVTDRKELEILEDAHADASMLEVQPFLIAQRSIGLETWKSVHKMMFGEVYDWAGELRTVRMSKGVSIFANPQFIERAAKGIFKKLEEDNYLRNMPLGKAAARLSFYHNELNAVHPFREGNGRSLNILISEIARRAGWRIAWEEIAFQESVAASIEGFSGNYEPLARIFERTLKPIPKKQ